MYQNETTSFLQDCAEGNDPVKRSNPSGIYHAVMR